MYNFSLDGDVVHGGPVMKAIEGVLESHVVRSTVVIFDTNGEVLRYIHKTGVSTKASLTRMKKHKGTIFVSYGTPQVSDWKLGIKVMTMGCKSLSNNCEFTDFSIGEAYAVF